MGIEFLTSKTTGIAVVSSGKEEDKEEDKEEEDKEEDRIIRPPPPKQSLSWYLWLPNYSAFDRGN